MNNLTPEMQARLEEWRKNVLEVPKAKIFTSPGNFVSRKGDYGDDIRDYEKKEESRNRENSMFRGYR